MVPSTSQTPVQNSGFASRQSLRRAISRICVLVIAFLPVARIDQTIAAEGKTPAGAALAADRAVFWAVSTRFTNRASSHCSPSVVISFPQLVGVQLLSQPSPLMRLPSSQTHPGPYQLLNHHKSHRGGVAPSKMQTSQFAPDLGLSQSLMHDLNSTRSYSPHHSRQHLCMLVSAPR